MQIVSSQNHISGKKKKEKKKEKYFNMSCAENFTQSANQ